ncbi:hypothetical protein WA026_009285 [Henosepilachna vigintioctopunctata]|uniref:Uncharacterized protein n=1 Tax=Henosepilachna vigintioctopunctata TaxID=420089 RepID=A0AAW1UYH4_9CUCU
MILFWEIRQLEISTEFNLRESLRLTASGEQSLKTVGTESFFIRTMELSKFSSLVAQDDTSSHYAEIDTPLSLCPANDEIIEIPKYNGVGQTSSHYAEIATPLSLCPPVCASEIASACLVYSSFANTAIEEDLSTPYFQCQRTSYSLSGLQAHFRIQALKKKTSAHDMSSKNVLAKKTINRDIRKHQTSGSKGYMYLSDKGAEGAPKKTISAPHTGIKSFFIRSMELSKFSSLVAQDENSSHYAEIDMPLSLCTPVCGSEVAAALLGAPTSSLCGYRVRRRTEEDDPRIPYNYAQDETSYNLTAVDTPLSLCTSVCGSEVAAAFLRASTSSLCGYRLRRRTEEDDPSMPYN